MPRKRTTTEELVSIANKICNVIVFKREIFCPEDFSAMKLSSAASWRDWPMVSRQIINFSLVRSKRGMARILYYNCGHKFRAEPSSWTANQNGTCRCRTCEVVSFDYFQKALKFDFQSKDGILCLEEKECQLK